MAESSLQKHSEDLTTISKGQSRQCMTPKLVSFVYGDSKAGIIHLCLMVMLKYILTPCQVQGPCLKGFPQLVLQNLALVKIWQMSSTQEINKIGKKLPKLGKHKLRPEKLGKLNNLKNSKKRKKLKNFTTLPWIARGNLSHEWCSILPWQKATKNASVTGFLNLHLNHFMHWCSCRSYMFWQFISTNSLQSSYSLTEIAMLGLLICKHFLQMLRY